MNIIITLVRLCRYGAGVATVLITLMSSPLGCQMARSRNLVLIWLEIPAIYRAHEITLIDVANSLSKLLARFILHICSSLLPSSSMRSQLLIIARVHTFITAIINQIAPWRAFIRSPSFNLFLETHTVQCGTNMGRNTCWKVLSGGWRKVAMPWPNLERLLLRWVLALRRWT